MSQLLDIPYLLRLAERLPGDPGADDLGPLFAAVARHSAAALDTEVYGSDHLKAGALLHTLARLPALEHSNLLFAFTAAAAFLEINGHQVSYTPADAVKLTEAAADGHIGVREIARTLRHWTR